jgi:hypothetical protein
MDASRIRLADIQRCELSITKALEGVPTTTTARAVSCFACFCTEGCISSLSSSCTVEAATADRDPAVVQAICTLHDRAVAVLGEEGAAAALRSRVPQAITR